MAWLWTDTLAALLVEHDGITPDRVADWVRRPMAYRLDEDQDPLTLARRILLGLEDATRADDVAIAG